MKARITPGFSSAPDANACLSLTRGGPLFRLERKLRMCPDDVRSLRRLIIAALCCTWVPVILLAIAQRIASGQWDPLITRSEVHVRLLVCVPLLLIGERSLEVRVADVTARLVHEDVLPATSAERWQGLLERLHRARDALGPEAVLFLAVYGASFAAFAQRLPDWALRWAAPTLHHASTFAETRTPAWWWYVLVGQPLLLFVILRWLYRWALWTRLLAAVPGFRPRLRPGHADRAGGIGFLGHPLFSLRFLVGAAACGLSSVWFDEIAHHKAQPSTFAGDLIGFLVAVLLIAFGPYLILSPIMVVARREADAAYSALVHHYVERFDRRWLRPQPGADMLGHPDFSGLADLGTSYQVVRDMRGVVPDFDELRLLLAVAVVPFFANLVAYGGSAADLLQRILTQFLGG